MRLPAMRWSAEAPECARRIKAIARSALVPVIFTGGAGGADGLVRALDAGGDDHHAGEGADEPGVALDQAPLVPASKAEAADAVGRLHPRIIVRQEKRPPGLATRRAS